MSSAHAAKLTPSLWRTCRVLANRPRLRILAYLFKYPDQCVSDIADHFGIPPSVASRYLREMNARGLLAVVRSSRWVRYRPYADRSVPQAEGLLAALKDAFGSQKKPEEFIFRQVTAFTHPRRVAVVSAVGQGCARPADLARRTGISLPALVRHLRKLKRRGFLCAESGTYYLTRSTSILTKTLLQLAQEVP